MKTSNLITLKKHIKKNFWYDDKIEPWCNGGCKHCVLIAFSWHLVRWCITWTNVSVALMIMWKNGGFVHYSFGCLCHSNKWEYTMPWTLHIEWPSYLYIWLLFTFVILHSILLVWDQWVQPLHHLLYGLSLWGSREGESHVVFATYYTH
jgi:hypothetical protein